MGLLEDKYQQRIHAQPPKPQATHRKPARKPVARNRARHKGVTSPPAAPRVMQGVRKFLGMDTPVAGELQAQQRALTAAKNLLREMQSVNVNIHPLRVPVLESWRIALTNIIREFEACQPSSTPSDQQSQTPTQA